VLLYVTKTSPIEKGKYSTTHYISNDKNNPEIVAIEKIIFMFNFLVVSSPVIFHIQRTNSH
jgi:hypothetical protein